MSFVRPSPVTQRIPDNTSFLSRIIIPHVKFNPETKEYEQELVAADQYLALTAPPPAPLFPHITPIRPHGQRKRAGLDNISLHSMSSSLLSGFSQMFHVYPEEITIPTAFYINSEDEYGNTPLIQSLILSDQLQSSGDILYLLNARADVNHVNHHGLTPLSYAFSSTSAETVALLVSYHANIFQHLSRPIDIPSLPTPSEQHVALQHAVRQNTHDRQNVVRRLTRYLHTLEERHQGVAIPTAPTVIAAIEGMEAVSDTPAVVVHEHGGGVHHPHNSDALGLTDGATAPLPSPSTTPQESQQQQPELQGSSSSSSPSPSPSSIATATTPSTPTATPPPPQPPPPLDIDYTYLNNRLILPNNDEHTLLYTALLTPFRDHSMKFSMLYAMLYAEEFYQYCHEFTNYSECKLLPEEFFYHHHRTQLEGLSITAYLLFDEFVTPDDIDQIIKQQYAERQKQDELLSIYNSTLERDGTAHIPNEHPQITHHVSSASATPVDPSLISQQQNDQGQALETAKQQEDGLHQLHDPHQQHQDQQDTPPPPPPPSHKPPKLSRRHPTDDEFLVAAIHQPPLHNIVNTAPSFDLPLELKQEREKKEQARRRKEEERLSRMSYILRHPYSITTALWGAMHNDMDDSMHCPPQDGSQRSHRQRKKGRKDKRSTAGVHPDNEREQRRLKKRSTKESTRSDTGVGVDAQTDSLPEQPVVPTTPDDAKTRLPAKPHSSIHLEPLPHINSTIQHHVSSTFDQIQKVITVQRKKRAKRAFLDLTASTTAFTRVDDFALFDPSDTYAVLPQDSYDYQSQAYQDNYLTFNTIEELLNEENPFDAYDVSETERAQIKQMSELLQFLYKQQKNYDILVEQMKVNGLWHAHNRYMQKQQLILQGHLQQSLDAAKDLQTQTRLQQHYTRSFQFMIQNPSITTSRNLARQREFISSYLNQHAYLFAALYQQPSVHIVALLLSFQIDLRPFYTPWLHIILALIYREIERFQQAKEVYFGYIDDYRILLTAAPKMNLDHQAIDLGSVVSDEDTTIHGDSGDWSTIGENNDHHHHHNNNDNNDNNNSNNSNDTNDHHDPLQGILDDPDSIVNMSLTAFYKAFSRIRPHLATYQDLQDHEAFAKECEEMIDCIKRAKYECYTHYTSVKQLFYIFHLFLDYADFTPMLTTPHHDWYIPQLIAALPAEKLFTVQMVALLQRVLELIYPSTPPSPPQHGSTDSHDDDNTNDSDDDDDDEEESTSHQPPPFTFLNPHNYNITDTTTTHPIDPITYALYRGHSSEVIRLFTRYARNAIDIDSLTTSLASGHIVETMDDVLDILQFHIDDAYNECRSQVELSDEINEFAHQAHVHRLLTRIHQLEHGGSLLPALPHDDDDDDISDIILVGSAVGDEPMGIIDHPINSVDSSIVPTDDGSSIQQQQQHQQQQQRHQHRSGSPYSVIHPSIKAFAVNSLHQKEHRLRIQRWWVVQQQQQQQHQQQSQQQQGGANIHSNTPTSIPSMDDLIIDPSELVIDYDELEAIEGDDDRGDGGVERVSPSSIDDDSGDDISDEDDDDISDDHDDVNDDHLLSLIDEQIKLVEQERDAQVSHNNDNNDNSGIDTSPSPSPSQQPNDDTNSGLLLQSSPRMTLAPPPIFAYITQFPYTSSLSQQLRALDHLEALWEALGPALLDPMITTPADNTNLLAYAVQQLIAPSIIYWLASKKHIPFQLRNMYGMCSLDVLLQTSPFSVLSQDLILGTPPEAESFDIDTIFTDAPHSSLITTKDVDGGHTSTSHRSDSFTVTGLDNPTLPSPLLPLLGHKYTQAEIDTHPLPIIPTIRSLVSSFTKTLTSSLSSVASGVFKTISPLLFSPSYDACPSSLHRTAMNQPQYTSLDPYSKKRLKFMDSLSHPFQLHRDLFIQYVMNLLRFFFHIDPDFVIGYSDEHGNSLLMAVIQLHKSKALVECVIDLYRRYYKHHYQHYLTRIKSLISLSEGKGGEGDEGSSTTTDPSTTTSSNHKVIGHTNIQSLLPDEDRAQYAIITQNPFHYTNIAGESIWDVLSGVSLWDLHANCDGAANMDSPDANYYMEVYLFILASEYSNTDALDAALSEFERECRNTYFPDDIPLSDNTN